VATSRVPVSGSSTRCPVRLNQREFREIDLPVARGHRFAVHDTVNN
jgi:hypothetical protein